MAHNLFGERFYSNREVPWHGLGRIGSGETAMQAWSSMTPYEIELVTLESVYRELEIPYRAIVRTETPDDPRKRVLGLVGSEYTLVSPQEVCEIYDRAVNQPIETLGSLGRGETLFLATKLPDIDVKGDLVSTYMLTVSPYTGNAAMEVRVTPVRVVCQNTLNAARRQTTELYKVVHDKTASIRLESWMSGLYERAARRTETLSQFFNLLAEYKPSSKTVPTILGKIYPDPIDPRGRANAPDDVIAKRVESYEINLKSSNRSRTAVMELFDGAGTGLNTPVCRGTGWGLYNAVAEWNSWSHTTAPSARIESVLLGSRAQSTEMAYSTILDYAMRALK